MAKAKEKKATQAASLGITTFSEPQTAELKKSFLILKYARESSESLFQTFKASRKEKKSGTTSDEEQDLLRAMVVFAAAGLDSLLKQIVKDALPEILKKNKAAQEELEKYTRRALQGKSRAIGAEGDEGNDSSETDHKFLAEVLVADSPRDEIIKRLIENLIGESLQSTNQVFKVVRFLGIKEKFLTLSNNKKKFDKVFKTRNQIIHEMDIDFSSTNRNRFGRKQTEMQEATKSLLKLGDEIFSAVYSLLLPK